MSSLPEWMNKFLLIAHRGASAYEPENTIKAFKRAIELGADAIEFDIRLTRDGVPVVFHDEDLKRLVGIDVKVRDLSLTELKQYNVMGEEIPTLDEVLSEIGGSIPLFIEIKDVEAVDKVVKAIIERKLIDDSLIISFHREAIIRAKEIDKRILTGLITVRRNVHAKDLVRLGIVSLLPRYDVITPRFIKELHVHKLKVYAWTVNDPSLATKLISYGVDGIATDKPDLKRDVSKQQTLLKYFK